MILMVSGNELDPICGSLARVVALTHALWDTWMPHATMVNKCVRVAHEEQRETARSWLSVKGLFGAVVATLKRVQWTTTLERHRALLVRGARARIACISSLEKATRAWQWRRVALHCFRDAAARTDQLAAHDEEACCRLVIVDGQWSQLLKCRAAQTLSPLCDPLAREDRFLCSQCC